MILEASWKALQGAIDAGEVIASGPPEEIRRNPRVLATYF